MSGDTKESSHTESDAEGDESWKDRKVSKGQTWRQLHNKVINLHQRFGIDMHTGRNKSGDSTGNTEEMKKAQDIHNTLRAWEKKNINQNDRVHHTAWKGFGQKYMEVKDKNTKYDEKHTTMLKGVPVILFGGKKRKPKRKKTKRKKPKRKKTKRRKKTRKHKRRKRRKTKRKTKRKR